MPGQPTQERGSPPALRCYSHTAVRLLAVVALVVVFAASASAGAASRSSRTGVLHGTVTHGPACSPGQLHPCSEPIPGVEIVFRHGSRLVAHTTTTADGTYRIRLHAGRYGIHLPGHSHSQPTHARVFSGQVTRLNIAIDALTR